MIPLNPNISLRLVMMWCNFDAPFPTDHTDSETTQLLLLQNFMELFNCVFPSRENNSVFCEIPAG